MTLPHRPPNPPRHDRDENPPQPGLPHPQHGAHLRLVVSNGRLLDNPSLRAEEAKRADGLRRKIAEILADPDSPLNSVLHHYEAALRDASAHAGGAR